MFSLDVLPIVSMVELTLTRKHHAGEIDALSRDHIETGLGYSWTVERVAANIDAPEGVVLAGTHIGRLAGFAIMHFGIEDTRLDVRADKPDYQRGGLGHRLVKWPEESALTAGISII